VNDTTRYAGAAGLTWGTASLHILEVLLVFAGTLPMSNKVFIAISGALIYSVSTVLLAMRRRSGAWLIVLMPIVGALAVAGGWLLHLDVHPDLFNLVILGVQLPGIVLAGGILGWWGQRSRPAGLSATA